MITVKCIHYSTQSKALTLTSMDIVKLQKEHGKRTAQQSIYYDQATVWKMKTSQNALNILPLDSFLFAGHFLRDSGSRRPNLTLSISSCAISALTHSLTRFSVG